MAWIGVSVSVAVFLLGLVLSGGIPGMMIRRARQRQDFIDLLAKTEGAATREQSATLKAEQHDDLRSILAERERRAGRSRRLYRLAASIERHLYPRLKGKRHAWAATLTLMIVVAVLGFAGGFAFAFLQGASEHVPRWSHVGLEVLIAGAGLMWIAIIVLGLSLWSQDWLNRYRAWTPREVGIPTAEDWRTALGDVAVRVTDGRGELTSSRFEGVIGFYERETERGPWIVIDRLSDAGQEYDHFLYAGARWLANTYDQTVAAGGRIDELLTDYANRLEGRRGASGGAEGLRGAYPSLAAAAPPGSSGAASASSSEVGGDGKPA